MATSGWQDERTLTTWGSGNRTVGNIAIDGISHNGDYLRVWGAVAVGRRGSGCQWWNYGVKISVAGDGERYIIGSNTQQCVGNDFYSNFDVTVYVPASQTSWDIPVYFRACYNSDCSSIFWDKTEYWHLDFGTGGSAPYGPSITYNSSTWNSVNMTSRINGWGGLPGSLQAILVTGSANGQAANATPNSWDMGRIVYDKPNTWDTANTVNATQNNISFTLRNPIEIKGLLHYKLLCWASNSAGSTYVLDNTLRYLPPAPAQFSYTDPGGVGAKTFPITFSNIAGRNFSQYDTASLSRVIRYKIDNGPWVTVESGTALIDAPSNFNVTVPPQSTVTIEGWQTYHGMASEVSTITIPNNNAPINLYGSVSGASKKVDHLYGPVNGETKKIVKLYGSVNGVTRRVFEDV